MSRNAIIAVVVWIVGAIVLNTCGAKKGALQTDENITQAKAISHTQQPLPVVHRQDAKNRELQTLVEELRFVSKEKAAALEKIKAEQNKAAEIWAKEKEKLEAEVKQLNDSNSLLIARAQELAMENEKLAKIQKSNHHSLEDAISKVSVLTQLNKNLEIEKNKTVSSKNKISTDLEIMEKEKLQALEIVKELKEKNQKLEKLLVVKNENAKQSFNTLMQSKKELEEKLKAENRKHLVQKDELSRTRAELTELKKEIMKQKEVYQGEKRVRIMAEEETVQALKEIERLKMLLVEKNGLMQTVKELNVSNSKLQTQLKKLPQVKAKLEKLEKEKETHEKILQAEEEARVKTEAKFKEAIEENKKLKELLAERSTQAEHNLTVLVQEKDALTKEVLELNASNRDLQAKADDLSRIKARLEELENENTALNSDLETEKSGSVKIKEEYRQVSEENKKLKDLLKEKEASMEKKTVATAQDKKALEKKIHELTAANEKLKASYRKEEDTSKSAFAKLATLMEIQKNLNIEKNKIVASKKQSDVKLEEEIRAKQKALGEIDSLKTENKKLQILLQENREYIDKSLKSITENKDRLEQRVVELEKDKTTLTKELEAAGKSIRGAQEKMKLLMGDNDSLKLKVRRESESKAKLEAYIKAKEELLSALALTHVKFRTSSPKLLRSSRRLLDSVAEAIKKHPNFRYEIQGHTDNTGDEENNIELSQERAQSVKNYLVEKGVDASILEAKGFGSSQPVAPNDTRAGKLQNRRVIFKIIKP